MKRRWATLEGSLEGINCRGLGVQRAVGFRFECLFDFTEGLTRLDGVGMEPGALLNQVVHGAFIPLPQCRRAGDLVEFLAGSP